MVALCSRLGLQFLWVHKWGKCYLHFFPFEYLWSALALQSPEVKDFALLSSAQHFSNIFDSRKFFRQHMSSEQFEKGLSSVTFSPGGDQHSHVCYPCNMEAPAPTHLGRLLWPFWGLACSLLAFEVLQTLPIARIMPPSPHHCLHWDATLRQAWGSAHQGCPWRFCLFHDPLLALTLCLVWC